ncbi:MAG: YdeI/OmpD-associated family protein [bacterium]|nr:YdeI/OmpD-associated family protein [bacterium]
METPFQSKIDYLEKLKLHYISVSEELLQQFHTPEDTGSVFNQRFLVTINDEVSWRAGSVSLGNREAYITLSKARMKKLGVDKGDSVSVLLKKDTSKYGMDVPEEFEELLRQDNEARKRFEALTMGVQRASIYIIAQLKSSQKRIDKSVFLMENLKKAPAGKETMRHILGKEIS